MREGNDMGWNGRIPLFRLIGETVLPVGFFAAGSSADLFACLESHVSHTTDSETSARLARNDLEVYA